MEREKHTTVVSPRGTAHLQDPACGFIGSRLRMLCEFTILPEEANAFPVLSDCPNCETERVFRERNPTFTPKDTTKGMPAPAKKARVAPAKNG